MKYFGVVFMFLLISSVTAIELQELGIQHVSGPTGGNSDGTVYSLTYDFGLLQNGYSNMEPRRVCDDFELSYPTMIDAAYVWMIWTGQVPSTYNLAVSEDDTGDSNPNTNTEIWAESVPCINTFTGDNNWGYDIYETYCDIDSGVLLYDGIHYYFETQAPVVDNCFILACPNVYGDLCWYDDGSGVWVRVDIAFGDETDLFLVLCDDMALESETWGSIKTLF